MARYARQEEFVCFSVSGHAFRRPTVLQDYEAAREDIKNKNTEDLNVMKITLESTIDELEKKFEISHEAYLMQVTHAPSLQKRVA